MLWATRIVYFIGFVVSIGTMIWFFDGFSVWNRVNVLMILLFGFFFWDTFDKK